jgi:hypothetical protein
MDRYQGPRQCCRVTANLEAVFAMIRHGALFRSRNDGTNEKTCFELYVDRMDRFNVPDTTIAIFDGTADISPMYRFHEDRFERIDTRRFRRSLANLHVHILDQRTGSAHLLQQSEAYYTELFQDIRERMEPVLCGTPCTVFTYKKVRERFHFDDAFGQGNVFHFGDIKGMNRLNDRRAIAQVGVNQYPKEQYCLMSLIGDSAATERFLALSAEEQRSEIAREANTADSRSNALRTACQLVSTEQCIFRGCIREVVGSEYHYFLWCRTRYFHALIEAMKERYRRLDGTVSVTEKSLAEEIMDYMHRGNPGTRGKRIIRAILSFGPETQFSARDIYQQLDISYDQYKQTVHDTPVIKRLLRYDQVGNNTYQGRFRMPARPLIPQQNAAAPQPEEEPHSETMPQNEIVPQNTKSEGKKQLLGIVLDDYGREVYRFTDGSRIYEAYWMDDDEEDDGLPF